MVAGATRLIVGASGSALDGGVLFLSEFSIMVSAFTLGQVLNFGSLAYVTDCYGEPCPLNGAAPIGNKLPTLPPSTGLLGADLEDLA